MICGASGCRSGDEIAADVAVGAHGPVQITGNGGASDERVARPGSGGCTIARREVERTTPRTAGERRPISERFRASVFSGGHHADSDAAPDDAAVD